MNFFEYQEQARRQSRWLVFLFVLAVVIIIIVIDIAILVAFGFMNTEEQQALFNAGTFKENLPMLAGGAVVTAAVIAIASLFKTASLRSGGGKVARDLGGVLVEADARDPLRRRLYNVVEEIALASGIAVPEIYVLEQESGINAFAAGFTPADAAVAVTRGALEKLDRSELQGVIAHEFSHIFNGDMRLNIRLMGALFGILMLSLIGRRVLHGSYYVGRSKNNNGGAIVLIAVVVMLVGYIGLFFGRWIKSAVSRQREYLADASAVQFTRDPDGIAGALKKIAVYSDASYLNVETEEVSHMLFGNGEKVSMFSTHPPLNQRIQRIDKTFQPEDLVQLARNIQRKSEAQAERAAREQKSSAAGAGGMFNWDNLVEQIGHPDFSRILMAATLAASIPEEINQAAHSNQWATEVLFYCLMDADEEIREQQLLFVAQNMGSDSEARVRGLLSAAPQLAREQRLPLLEIAIPELKRRPPDHVNKVLATVKALSEADGQTDVFEYLMAKIIAQHLWESVNPQRVRLSGKKSLSQVIEKARQVVAVLALQGNRDKAGAESAYRAGSTILNTGDSSPMPEIPDWKETLDANLSALDQLKPSDKETLVKALVATVMADEKIAVTEMELLRVVCLVIHVPLPMIGVAQS
ncbi:MAG: M48 family metallopeptidase [Gammaproteobacteria bacterium]|nr:M48 family metallopeptidase [Gammaproteobacteria bacterium]